MLSLIEKIVYYSTEINSKSPYYNLILDTFNDNETASVVDKLHQISMDFKERNMIMSTISDLTEPHFKYGETNYKISINLEEIVYKLSQLNNYVPGFDPRKIHFIKGDIGNQTFGCIYDSLPRRETSLYDYNYLRVMSLFTREKEILTTWQERMKSVAKNNLMSNAYTIIKTYPKEEIERLDSIFRKLKYNKIEDGIYKKPSLKDIVTRKKINRFY